MMTFSGLPTGRIDPDVMNTIPRDMAQWIFNFRRDDIQARFKLIALLESLLKSDALTFEAHKALIHAEMYLTDRSDYERLKALGGVR